MKAYEKWARQNMYDRIETEKAWRAALEMVQNWYKEAREGFDLGLWDMLKNELGEGAE